MKTHLRVIEEKEVGSSHSEVSLRLANALSAIDGVSLISPITLHSRGGYSVSIDILDSAFSELTAELEAAGFRFVI